MIMKELFSLGALYPSDFLKPGEQPRCQPVEMKLLMDHNNLVRLEKPAPPEAMYGKYWYRSGINYTMRAELENIVQSIMKVYGHYLTTGDIWLDIACNDGTLLSYVSRWLQKVGIDPADDSFLKESEKHGHIIQDYFSAVAYWRHNRNYGKKAKVITSIAMFYDLDDPEAFIRDIDQVLDDNGLWVMQLSYTPLMLQQLAFDNICHEHIYYYSLGNLKAMLERNGFRIMDCQLNDINGGSMRVYIMKEKANHSLFGSQPYRDVCRVRVESLLKWENYIGTGSANWYVFFDELQMLKTKTRTFIRLRVAEGKKVWGYGASTKGNTLLQYFGLDHRLITAIADRSEYKWGLRTVGTDIPIVSEADMRAARPDYLLVLPWHFINEFMDREKEYLAGGGKFIVPCPEFKIIGG